MKRVAAITLLIGAILCLGVAYAEVREPYDLTVRELYSAPTESSNLIYRIPVEVRVLDISEDCNWYKVKVGFSLGPLAYTYVGWTKIPLGETLASRDSLYTRLNKSAEQSAVISDK